MKLGLSIGYSSATNPTVRADQDEALALLAELAEEAAPR